ncbi:MAG: hypothetical protein EXQ85_03135 [Alphaproteobacteria bacterium]|nr:hypothetical protein [Alphaproteobacteria bacterium]
MSGPIWFYSLLWGAVGAIQTAVNSDFLLFLVSRQQVSFAGRGVQGLSPEPTHYGLNCLLILFLALMHVRRYRLALTFVLVVQIFLFARSATAIAILVLFVGLVLAMRLASWKGTVAVGLLGLASPFLIESADQVLQTFAGARAADLALAVMSDPVALLSRDWSLNQRFFHIFFSAKGAFENFLLPNGFDAFAEYSRQQSGEYRDSLSRDQFGNVIPVESVQILSGLGGALFHLGLVGFLIPLSLAWLIHRHLGSQILRTIPYCGLLFAILLMAMPLGTPLIGVIAGYLAYRVHGKSMPPEARTA